MPSKKVQLNLMPTIKKTVLLTVTSVLVFNINYVTS